MRKSFDPSVYFVLDPSLCAGREPVDVAQAAIKGGITMLQYRDKSFSENVDSASTIGSTDASSSGLILRNSELLREVAAEAGVSLLINDHVDIAKEIGADGVHLGQDDMSAGEARDILGPEAIVGVTAFTQDQIAAINPDIVDYIGIGPFYVTQTRKGKPVLGPSGERDSSEVGRRSKFAELAEMSPVPVVGIGGITPENAGAVIAAGADGVAMMRSVSEADDPEKVVQEFVQNVKVARFKEAS